MKPPPASPSLKPPPRKGETIKSTAFFKKGPPLDLFMGKSQLCASGHSSNSPPAAAHVRKSNGGRSDQIWKKSFGREIGRGPFFSPSKVDQHIAPKTLPPKILFRSRELVYFSNSHLFGRRPLHMCRIDTLTHLFFC